ncbi:unnamed protein product, partial [Nippostrongylus brasiliensis]|uniref:Trifunctional enzyme subunit alpha, mitochondrial (inferred by orthology to a human protein) n=1 Tax=Nippostrongylus brasiliensis TaxID=27835 RepID=A0A0N4YNC5_NIPBR
MCRFCYERYVHMCLDMRRPIPASYDRGMWHGHNMKERGVVTCPHLYAATCSYCGATRQNAHTDDYCPLRRNEAMLPHIALQVKVFSLKMHIHPFFFCQQFAPFRNDKPELSEGIWSANHGSGVRFGLLDKGPSISLIRQQGNIWVKGKMLSRLTHGSRLIRTVRVDNQGDVAVIKMNLPNTKENVLNEEISADLQAAFDKVEHDDSVKSVVLMSAKPNSFIAGADVNMLSKAKTPMDGANISKQAQQQFERLEKSGKPVVAAIMGSCMGGGLE